MLEHADGKDTCGCTIMQDVFLIKIYFRIAGARPSKPEDFDKPADADWWTQVWGRWVFTRHRGDDGDGDTQCEDKQATINDTPHFFLNAPIADNDRLSGYSFSAFNYVKEAPSVSGSFFLGAKWRWNDRDKKVRASLSANSSDGTIDHSGSFENEL